MPVFSEIRSMLLLAYDAGWIDDVELLLLTIENTSSNLELPYWIYPTFDLDLFTDDHAWNEFRFDKDGIYQLVVALNLPEKIVCSNGGSKADSVVALCILLKRLAQPGRYADMIPIFGKNVPVLSSIFNQLLNFIYERWKHLFSNLNQTWLRPEVLAQFCLVVYEKSGALDNCWGFVDATVRSMCRPKSNEAIVYNQNKKVHSLKYQVVGVPNGMIANLYGPVEGKMHDTQLLADSGLLSQLQQYSVSPTGEILCLFGDRAYPLRQQLQRPFLGDNLSELEKAWNTSMSKVRVSVEWIFGEVISCFRYVDFKKNLKINSSSIGKMYIICALLHNARCCLYGSKIADYFGVTTPSLNEYFVDK